MEFIIKEFVSNLTENDINNFALKEGIMLENEELKTIYMYIKNYWQIFYKEDANYLLKELKEKLKPNTYTKIVELLNKYKKK